MSASFRLALVQMAVRPGEPLLNRARALELIEAAAAKADVILLPEALPFGWTDPSSVEAEAIPSGGFCPELAAAARIHRRMICAGVVERAGNRIFNSAVLIDPRGEVILVHRKVNELAIGHECYALGDRLGVVETEFGRMGVMICADAFAPGQPIARTMGLMGARVILSPCAWAVPPEHDNAATPYGQLWLDNYGPVAREFGLWIAGCSNVGPIRTGPWAGHRCIGNSLVVGPDGAERLCGPHGEAAETILYLEVTPGREFRPSA